MFQDFDLFDEVLLVDQRLDLELARHRERDRRRLLAAFRLRLHGGVVLEGGLDEAMRRDPQLMQSVADGHRRRIDRTLAELTPGQRAAHRRRQALAAGDWQPAAARHRIALGPDHLIAQRRRLVIDRAGVALQAEARPWLAGSEALAKREEGAAARIL